MLYFQGDWTGEQFGGVDLAMIHIGYVQFSSAFHDVDDRLRCKIRDGLSRLLIYIVHCKIVSAYLGLSGEQGCRDALG